MKKNISIVVIAAICIATGLLWFQNKSPQSRKVTAPPTATTLSNGPLASVPLKDSGPVDLPAPTAQEQKRNVQANTAQEQKRIAWQKSLEEGVKLFRQGAFARTYARLEPVLRQSGLSASEIDSSVALYVDIIFARTREEHNTMVEKMKAQVGEEVYDGIEKTEEDHRNRIRDEQLLAGLKAGLPSLPQEDISAAMAGFASLPNFNTLYMQEVRFQPSTVDLAANMRAVAEAAFDKAFANSPISASAREQLKKTYVTIALSMTPARKK
ncbi:MAG: hypothetical protein HY302_01795 [Opitutae bacterium]|nr:hypothetical protein [Opitutae bacterium]